MKHLILATTLLLLGACAPAATHQPASALRSCATSPAEPPRFTREQLAAAVEPIADLAGLETRRAAAGLPPMAEYVKQLSELYQLPVEWPPQR